MWRLPCSHVSLLAMVTCQHGLGTHSGICLVQGAFSRVQLAPGQWPLGCAPVFWAAVHCLGAAPCTPMAHWPHLVQESLCRLWCGVHGVAVDRCLIHNKGDTIWHHQEVIAPQHMAVSLFLDCDWGRDPCRLLCGYKHRCRGVCCILLH